MHRALKASILAACALAMGCSTTITPVPPPLAPPVAFSAEGSAPLLDQWWQSLGDQRLDALMERAMAGNFSLRSAYDRLQQARASVRVARADLLPDLDADVSASQTIRRDDITRNTDTNQNLGLGLSASYEVDLWGRIRSLRNAEELEAYATAEDLRAAAVTLSGSVASTWFRLLEQEAQLDLLDSQVQTTAETLQVLEARFRRGATGASDVLQQRQLLESRTEDRERAAQQRRLLEISLAALLGQAPPARGAYEAEGGLPELPPLPAMGIPADAVARRPDVRTAYLQVQATDQRVAAAIANRYPRLSLSASYGTDDENWQDLFDNWAATLAANLVAPIFDGGQRRAEVDRQQAVLSERFNQYAEVYLGALAEVESALVSEQQAARIVESIDKQLSLARDVLDRVTTEYLNGSAQYLRVLDAQQSVQSLERDLLTGRRSLIESRVDLARALSGGWDVPAYPPAPVVEPETSNYPLPIPLPGEANG